MSGQSALEGLIDELRINVQVERVASVRAFLTEQMSSTFSDAIQGNEVWKDN